MNEEITKQNEIVAAMCRGDELTAAQISSVVPQIQLAKRQIKIIDEYVKAKAREGVEIEGLKVGKEGESKKIESATMAFSCLKDWLGDSFDSKKWAVRLSITEASIYSFVCECKGLKPTSKEAKAMRSRLEDVLGANLVKSPKAKSVRYEGE